MNKIKNKKFWEWMEKKDYGHKDKDGIWITDKKGIYYMVPIVQMLIGYMIQYLYEINDDRLTLPDVGGRVDISTYYDELKKMIERKEDSKWHQDRTKYDGRI